MSVTFNDYINEEEEDEEEIEVPQESYISKVLSEQTTKIVIILVLILLFILPFFQSDTYLSSITGQEQGLKWLAAHYDSASSNQSNWVNYQIAVD